MMKINKTYKSIKDNRWCTVDIDNIFNFDGKIFMINQDLKEYFVYNKAYEELDYTNECEMDSVYAVCTNDGLYSFFDENVNDITEHVFYIKDSLSSL